MFWTGIMHISAYIDFEILPFIGVALNYYVIDVSLTACVSQSEPVYPGMLSVHNVAY